MPRKKTGWRSPFLRALAASGNVRIAAREAGVDPGTVYGWRVKDAAFAVGWETAKAKGIAAAAKAKARASGPPPPFFERSPSPFRGGPGRAPHQAWRSAGAGGGGALVGGYRGKVH